MKQDDLKLVLDALKWCHGGEPCGTTQAIAVVEKALAQEQEPVAWVSEDVCKGQYIDGRPRKIWWECEKGVGTAFYTTSPQRTWVELEGEEIRNSWEEATKPDRSTMTMVTSFARAIEAKLKEKNSD